MKSLVFVHGYFGGSPQWAEQVELFSEHYNVVTPDLPGFGNRPDMEAPETIRGFANDILDELARQGLDRFHLVGHSMGGMIAQEMTALAPGWVDKLVLYGTGPVGIMPGRFETIEESRLGVVENGVEATGRRIAATWFQQGVEADGYPLCVDIAVQTTEQAALAGLTAMEGWSGVSALAQIESPTLVLWGDGDRAYLWEQPERLWREITNANLAVIPGCSHAVHLEKPGLFNTMLQDFLATG